MKNIVSSKKGFAYLLTMPVSIFLMCLLVLPILFCFYISFMSTSNSIENPQFVGLENYKEVFSSPIFLNSVKNTLIFVLATVLTTTIIGFLIALLLNDIKRHVGIFQTLLMLPLAVAPAVSGLTWGMMFNPLFGVVNYLLGFLGIPPLGWATETGTALLTIIIIDTWQWFPFVMIILYAGLQTIPQDIYEAARIDGSSRLQEIIHITIPMLKTTFVISLIFRFMDAFKSFDLIYTVTQGGPANATKTLVIQAYYESLKYYRLEIGAVIGIVLLIITFIITRFATKAIAK